MLSALAYRACIEARRAFAWPGLESYADVGCDGAYVTPYHLTCGNRSGPVLISFNWLDAPTARREHATLRQLGYLPGMLFNKVLDAALRRTGLTRANIYLTHAVHVLPDSRSGAVPQAAVDASFDTITRHEIAGRRVIALGQIASRACARAGITHSATVHPSARGLPLETKARAIAEELA